MYILHFDAARVSAECQVWNRHTAFRLIAEECRQSTWCLLWPKASRSAALFIPKKSAFAKATADSLAARRLAGEEGFEPPRDGSRARCLTAWLLPNFQNLTYCNLSAKALRSPEAKHGPLACPPKLRRAKEGLLPNAAKKTAPTITHPRRACGAPLTSASPPPRGATF